MQSSGVFPSDNVLLGNLNDRGNERTRMAIASSSRAPRETLRLLQSITSMIADNPTASRLTEESKTPMNPLTRPFYPGSMN